MQSDRHERISERAYRIWIADGQVHGKDIEHWQRAEREIADEEARLAAALAERAAGRATLAPRRPGTRAAPSKTVAAGSKAKPVRRPGRTAPATTRRTRPRAAPPAP